MNTHTSVSKQPLTMFVMMVIFVSLLVACGKREEAPASAPAQASRPTAEAEAQASWPAPASKAPKPAESIRPVPLSMPSMSPPPVGLPPPASSLSSVDHFLASMDWANIAFNSPPKLNLHETAQIQLLLSLKKTIDELREEIAAVGEREGAKVKVSNRMEARLSGPDFQITAITGEEQAVGSTDTVEWKWEIKPTASGRHNLHLTLTALFSVDGAATRRAVRTFDKTIEVEVTVGQWASDFFEKNWQWLWAAILLPIAGWLWKCWKSKNGASDLHG